MSLRVFSFCGADLASDLSRNMRANFFGLLDGECLGVLTMEEKVQGWHDLAELTAKLIPGQRLWPTRLAMETRSHISAPVALREGALLCTLILGQGSARVRMQQAETPAALLQDCAAIAQASYSSIVTQVDLCAHATTLQQLQSETCFPAVDMAPQEALAPMTQPGQDALSGMTRPYYDVQLPAGSLIIWEPDCVIMGITSEQDLTIAHFQVIPQEQEIFRNAVCVDREGTLQGPLITECGQDSMQAPSSILHNWMDNLLESKRSAAQQ